MLSRRWRWGISIAAGTAVLAVGLLVGTLRAKCRASSAVEAVAPGIYHVRNFLADIYAVRAGSGVLLFDAGMDREGHATDDLLAAMGAKRKDVRHVFLTHAHPDHVAAAPLFPNAQIHVGAADVDVLAQRAPVRPLTPRLFGAMTGSAPAIIANRPLHGRERISVSSEEQVLALPFPGHTPGSFLYLFRRVLFTGDSVLLEKGKLVPALPGNSVEPEQNHASIRALPELLAKENVDSICTGHMWCTRPGEAPQLLDELVRHEQK
jgi:glyoxylase-like metal-dependent hydrolase (beta-lactamase superfamily II)